MVPSNSSNEAQGRRPAYCLIREQEACLEKMKEITRYDREAEEEEKEEEEAARLDRDMDDSNCDSKGDRLDEE